MSIFDRQWDYVYLKKTLKDYKNNSVENIYAGSSYVIFGINNFKNQINIALPSQDIFYSLKIIKSLTASCKIPKRVILGVGYYSLFYDLSKTRNSNEVNRIFDVYYPLLLDSHNKDELSLKILYYSYGRINCLLRFICNIFISIFLKRNYFSNFLHSRQRRAIRGWNNKRLNWNEISEKERINCSIKRYECHFKQFKYKDTFRENIDLLREFYLYCKQQGIYFGIYISPMSKQYFQALSKRDKTCIVQSIKIFKEFCDKFVDYNIKLKLLDIDFVDPDHLSNSGAKKVTDCVVSDFVTN
uniref:hypothetical protein n=1 Tax=Succinivibrio sp. TaxID=2053619 RepID=UPI00402AF574